MVAGAVAVGAGFVVSESAQDEKLILDGASGARVFESSKLAPQPPASSPA